MARGLWLVILLLVRAAWAEPGLPVTLDAKGPYLILATPAASKQYAPALRRAAALHPGSRTLALDPARPQSCLGALRKLRPRYTLVCLTPRELTVDFAWRWLELTAAIDPDPFVDTRTGYLTGADTEGYFARLERVLAGKETVPALFVDNLGPGPTRMDEMRGSFFVSSVAGKLAGRSFAHATGVFPKEAARLTGTAGVLHLGGHGDPAGVIGGMQASDWDKIPLPPSFVFNGCCFGGVTDSSPSFCLAVLRKRPLAYFASLYPDHGMPVYQEIERLALRGGSAGDVIKGTHDEVILGLGGGMPGMPRLKPREAPAWSASQAMLYGTASRVLFGDPAVCLGVPKVASPFRMLEDRAVLLHAGLPATLTDTFHGDLCSQTNMFNARALLEWPASRGKLEGVEVEVWGKKLKSRLVGAAVEDGRVLRVQVDIESTGLFRSPFFVPGALVKCRFKGS